jgi:hypothetical protein
VSELWALLRDPRLSTSLVLAAAAGVGLALIGLGWRGAAATLLVPFQVPYLVSGAVLGLALLGAALLLLSVHLDRVEAAQERRQLGELQRDALRLLSTVAERRAAQR